jgi:hypothetical protein
LVVRAPRAGYAPGNSPRTHGVALSLNDLDNFEIPLIAHDIGYSVAAIAMLDSLGELHEPIASQVAKFSKYYQHWGPGIGRQIDDLEARLKQCGLPILPCWHTIPEYAQWSLAIANSAGEAPASGTPPKPLAGLGNVLGLLMRSTALYFLILRLAATAPQHEGIRYRLGRRREDFLRFVTDFEASARHPLLPASVRPVTEQLWGAADSAKRMIESPSTDSLDHQAASLESLHLNLRTGTALLLELLAARAPERRLAPLDALMVPLTCGDIGIPISGYKFLSTLGPVQGPLAERVATYQEMYRSKGTPFVAQQIADVEGRLGRYGLAIPPLPKNFEEYAQWYNVVSKTLIDAAGPNTPQWALAYLGYALGQMMLKLALHIVFERLRAVDPQHAALRSDEQWSRERLYGDIKTLAGAAEQLQPVLPPGARPYATELADQARMVQRLDESQEPGGLANQAARLEIVQYKIFEVTFALRAALGDRSTVVMCPIGII